MRHRETLTEYGIAHSRLQVLQSRVQRGSLYMKKRFSSVWITEALSKDFTLLYLRHRTTWIGEQSTFARIFCILDIQGMRIPVSRRSALPETVRFGLEIEPSTPFGRQNREIQVLERLWRERAGQAFTLIKSMGS